MTKIGERIVEGLRQFAQDLEDGRVDKYRRTKVVQLENGTHKRVVIDPLNHTEDSDNNHQE